MTGGVTFGIPTVIATLLAYDGTHFAEIKKNPEGTAFTVTTPDPQLLQLAGCLAEQAQQHSKREYWDVVPFKMIETQIKRFRFR